MKYIIVAIILVSARIAANDYIVGVDYVAVKNEKCMPKYKQNKTYMCERVFKDGFQ